MMVEAESIGKIKISEELLDRLPERWYITGKRSNL